MTDEELRWGENAELEAEITAFLQARPVMTLAVYDGSQPWAAALFFAARGGEFYFVSSAEARHSQCIGIEARAAATVQDQPKSWRKIRGVQLAGVVGRAEDTTEAMAVYGAKFPFVRRLYRPERDGFEIGWRFVAAPFFCFKATDLWWIDNSFGFGRRRHFILSESAR